MALGIGDCRQLIQVIIGVILSLGAAIEDFGEAVADRVVGVGEIGDGKRGGMGGVNDEE